MFMVVLVIYAKLHAMTFGDLKFHMDLCIWLPKEIGKMQVIIGSTFKKMSLTARERDGRQQLCPIKERKMNIMIKRKIISIFLEE